MFSKEKALLDQKNDILIQKIEEIQERYASQSSLYNNMISAFNQNSDPSLTTLDKF